MGHIMSPRWFFFIHLPSSYYLRCFSRINPTGICLVQSHPRTPNFQPSTPDQPHTIQLVPPICQLEPETTNHVLLSCNKDNQYGTNSTLTWPDNRYYPTTTVNDPRKYFSLVSFATWHMWLARNLKVYKNIHPVVTTTNISGHPPRAKRKDNTYNHQCQTYLQPREELQQYQLIKNTGLCSEQNDKEQVQISIILLLLISLAPSVSANTPFQLPLQRSKSTNPLGLCFSEIIAEVHCLD